MPPTFKERWLLASVTALGYLDVVSMKENPTMAKPLDDKPAVYVYSYPVYLDAAEASGSEPLVKIGMTERESVQRIAQQQRSTGSLEAPVVLRIWEQESGAAHTAERLMHSVLDAFGCRESGPEVGTEVFRVSLETLDRLAVAFGWAASKKREAVVASGGAGAAKDAWRTGRNKAQASWGFTYEQCARPSCGTPIDAESPTGSDGKYVYCSDACASVDDQSRSEGASAEGSSKRASGSSAAKDAWRTGRNNAQKSWNFHFPQCARPKCGKPIDDGSPTGSDGRFRYCTTTCATDDDRERGVPADK